jgi:hypothetical protein
MNTPTETPTPRVDEQKYNVPFCNNQVVVDADFARQLERELAAAKQDLTAAKQDLTAALIDYERVVRERDALANPQVPTYYDHELHMELVDPIWEPDSPLRARQVINAIRKHLAEANADRARLREALEAVKPDLLAMRSFIRLGGKSNWVGSEAQKSLRMLDEALSTPPPPVVPIQREEEAFSAGWHAGQLNRLGIGDTFETALAAYRAKHPLPQP